MTAPLFRRMTRGMLRLMQAVLPDRLRPWAMAMRHEMDAVEDDRAALAFALGCVRFLSGRLVAMHLLHPLWWPLGRAASLFISRRTSFMTVWNNGLRNPRLTVLWSAVGATGLGLAYLAAAGAPSHYLIVNMGALILGLLLSWGLTSTASARSAGAGLAALALAGVLLLTGLRGVALEGAARWITLGPLVVQPSLLLLPAVTIGFARSRDGLGTAGIVGAALALAIQPDRAMSGVLAAALMALALIRPDRNVMIALGATLIGFMTTLLRPDPLPAVPYVDRVLQSSFDLHPLIGAAVSAGAVLMLAPALVGWRHDPAHRESHAVFGAVWIGILLAALMGNYPTPLVGYGGSAILGYALCIVGLPRRNAKRSAPEEADLSPGDPSGDPAARTALGTPGTTALPLAAS